MFLENINNQADLQKSIEANQQLINALGKAGSIKVLAKKEEVPKGCIMDVSHATAEVYLNVKDYIDVGKQVRKDKKISMKPS